MQKKAKVCFSIKAIWEAMKLILKRTWNLLGGQLEDNASLKGHPCLLKYFSWSPIWFLMEEKAFALQQLIIIHVNFSTVHNCKPFHMLHSLLLTAALCKSMTT